MFDTPAHQGIFWLRFRVHAPDPADRVPNGAWLSGRIAYELYWDGVLMVRNGVPANRYEDEVPGRLDVVPTFPESLTGPGEHVVAMRISSYRCGATGDKSGFIFFMNDPRADSYPAERIAPTQGSVQTAQFPPKNCAQRAMNRARR